MKVLRFAEPLPGLVLSGEKDTTWRINDERNLSVGDVISCCYVSGIEFVKAEIIWVKETTFENLTTEDLEGHEKFSSDKEMYDTYSKYYTMKVTPKTKLKVVKFKLL